MAKLIYIFLIPWSLFAYASQAQAYADFSLDSTLEIFSKDGRKGLKNESGKIVLNAKYQAFGWSDKVSRKTTDFIGYKQNDQWGLMSKSLEVVSKPKYNSLVPFEDELFIVSEKSKYSKILFYGVIKENGKPKINLKYRNIYPGGNHLIAATKKEKDIFFGIINSSGKPVLPFEYFHIAYLGHSNFILSKENGRKELIKVAPKPELLLENIDSVSTFRDGVAIIFKNGKQGLIRQDGKILLPIEYKKIEWNNGKHIYVTPLNQWTILNQKGQAIDQHQADSVFYLNDTILVKSTSSFTQIYDTKTRENKQHFDGAVIGSFGDNFIVKKSDKTYIAKDSSKIISEKFSGEINWNQDFFVVKKKTYEGFKNIIINTEGNSITATDYRFSEPSIALKIKSNWGIYDKQLNELIPPLYQEIQKNGANYIVDFKGQYGVIDEHNNWIIPPQYREIQAISDSHYKLVDRYLREFLYDGNEKSEARLYYDIHGDLIIEQDVNDKFRLVDIHGNPLTNFLAGSYVGHDQSEVVFRDGNQHLLLNASGEILFKASGYDTVILYNDDYLAINKNDHWGFINKQGLLRIANRYDTVRGFQNDRAAMRIRNSWGFINRQEELVVQPYYSEVSDFEDKTAFVRINDKYGLINHKGNFIIEPEYHEIFKKDSFYLLRKGSRWGIASADGNIITYPTYDSIKVENNYIKVEKYESVRILLNDGNYLINDQYDEIHFDSQRKVYIAKKNAKKQQVFLTDILDGKYP